jgi:hypothetical protein
VRHRKLIEFFPAGDTRIAMRRLALLLLCLQTLAASAAQIDLAVIQFPEPKTEAELNTALAGVNLADITNSDRTITRHPLLRHSNVLFAQTTSPAALNSSTRLGAVRADVRGTYRNGRIDIRIDLSEGVQSGLRSFSSRFYQGSAALSPGSPKVVSLRVITKKTNTAVKGVPKVEESTTCHAVIAQIR